MKLLLILMFLCLNISAAEYTGIKKLKNFNKYDILFYKEYKKRFFIYEEFYSYKIIKAQAIQESNLNETDVSYVGASGLMQLMPTTYKDILKHKEILSNTDIIRDNIFDVKTNIILGVYYDQLQFKYFNNKNRTLETKFKLTFAAYNAGAGNILKSERICLTKQDDCIEYDKIQPHFQAAGFIYTETTNYVKRIFIYYNEMSQ